MENFVEMLISRQEARAREVEAEKQRHQSARAAKSATLQRRKTWADLERQRQQRARAFMERKEELRERALDEEERQRRELWSGRKRGLNAGASYRMEDEVMLRWWILQEEQREWRRMMIKEDKKRKMAANMQQCFVDRTNSVVPMRVYQDASGSYFIADPWGRNWQLLPQNLLQHFVHDNNDHLLPFYFPQCAQRIHQNSPIDTMLILQDVIEQHTPADSNTARTEVISYPQNVPYNIPSIADKDTPTFSKNRDPPYQDIPPALSSAQCVSQDTVPKKTVSAAPVSRMNRANTSQALTQRQRNSAATANSQRRAFSAFTVPEAPRATTPTSSDALKAVVMDILKASKVSEIPFYRRRGHSHVQRPLGDHTTAVLRELKQLKLHETKLRSSATACASSPK